MHEHILIGCKSIKNGTDDVTLGKLWCKIIRKVDNRLT